MTVQNGRLGIAGRVVVIAPSVMLDGHRWSVRGSRKPSGELELCFSPNQSGYTPYRASVPGMLRVAIPVSCLAKNDPIREANFTTTAVTLTKEGDGFLAALVTKGLPPSRTRVLKSKPKRFEKPPTAVAPEPAPAATVASDEVGLAAFKNALATVNLFAEQQGGSLSFDLRNGRVRATIMQEF